MGSCSRPSVWPNRSAALSRPWPRTSKLRSCLVRSRRGRTAARVIRPWLEPCPLRCIPKLLIERRQNDLLAGRLLPGQSGRELDSIGAVQSMLPRQCLGSLHQCFRDRHTKKILPISNEGPLSISREIVRHETRANSLGQRRSHFRATHARRRDHLGLRRQRDRFARAPFHDVPLHERARVEVRDHSRFSTTRSATVLSPRSLPTGFAGRSRRPLHAMAPALLRASTRTRKEAASGMMRATGRPCSVTTIVLPALTSRTHSLSVAFSSRMPIFNTDQPRGPAPRLSRSALAAPCADAVRGLGDRSRPSRRPPPAFNERSRC